MKLGEICELITKGTTPKQFLDNGIRYIKIEAFEENYINIEKCVFIDEQIHNTELKRSILKENDILFAIAGATIGKVNIVNKSLLPANTNQALAIIRLKDTENRDYILQILKSQIMQRYIKKSISVGAQPNLNLAQINNFSFPYPSFSEQEKIANIFSLIDERIQAQIKIIEKYESLIKGINERLFSQKIRFKNSNGENFPIWKSKKLGEISTITTGSSNREDSILDGEFIFFDRSQDIRTSNRYLFDKEAIIIPGEGQVFKPKYYTGKFDLHQRTYAIFDFVGGMGKYLYYYVSYEDKYLQSQAVGSTVKSLRLPMFQSMPIKLPCIEEQALITNFLSHIEEKIKTEKQFLNKLENQKQYLLQQMFI